MLLPQLLALACVQGITEFLPISSAGHLILLPQLSGWVDHGLAYDVAAHFGTLVAVVFYFRADLSVMLAHWCRNLAGGVSSVHSRLMWAVILATIPVSVFGLLFHDLIAQQLRNPQIIAATTIGFGIVLFAADRYGTRRRNVDSITWRDVMLVGFAQALALVPGTSRSGITISAGLALGLTRESAARFSFLLSIPVILLATGYETVHLIGSPTKADWSGLLTVALIACLSSFACIALFMRFLERVGMLPFVLYRIALGVLLIAIL
ncbi:MAG: undecaprenyl-diphosphate phosphatase [Gammaproteobacteria bacterium]